MALASSHAIDSAAAQFADRTRHHIALRLLPFLFALYIINYLDRTSMAYAAIGMSRELGFSDRVVGMGVGVFFISYVALQIPGAVLVERWSARKMISATMIAWGSMTTITALVHTPTQLYLARFLLGAAEAGFFPGVIVYLSHWVIRGDRAKATSNFMAAIPLSLVIGSPIAGWILGQEWFAVAGWRWLFVLEGMPAVLLGVVAFFFLTDWPSDAAWLDPEQQQWLTQKLEEEKPSHRHLVSVVQTLRSRTVLLLAGAAFFDYFAAYAIIFWLPTILKRQSGFSDMRVGLLGAIPYAVAFLAMLVNGWHSDRSCERRWHTVVPLVVTAAGLLGLIHPTELDPGDDRMAHHGVRIHGISLELLGDPDRDPERFDSGVRSRDDQRPRKYRGLCRPLHFGIPEHSNGIFLDWFHSADDVRIG